MLPRMRVFGWLLASSLVGDLFNSKRYPESSDAEEEILDQSIENDEENLKTAYARRDVATDEDLRVEQTRRNSPNP